MSLAGDPQSSLEHEASRSSRAALITLLLAAAGLAVAVAGQYIITRNFEDDLPWLERIAIHVRGVYGYHRFPRSVVAAAGLLVAGAVLFAAGTLHLCGGNDVLSQAEPAPRRTLPQLLRKLGHRWLAMILLAVGGAGWLLVILRLFQDEYQHALTNVFWFSLVMFGLACLVFWWRSSVRIPLGIRWWEPVLIVAAIVFFMVVNVRDIESWKYAAIGDEYVFFTFAQKMQIGQDEQNIFSQIGVYMQRPVGTSALQALSMSIFGADNFGWRIATPIALAAAIPAVYILGRELFDRQVAAFATLFFATSHYLTSYAHTVYDNVWALVPFAWAVALMVVGLRRSSPPWMYAAGVVAGLTVYTFPTARMAPLVMLLFIATLGLRAWKPRLLVPLLGAMFVTAMPLLASDKWKAISVSRDRTLFGFTDSATEGSWDRFVENLPRSFLGFNNSPGGGHFVSGSLLDPIAAVLFVLGLAYALVRIKQPAYRLLLLWFGLALVFAGLLSPYDRVAYDRLHLLLPVLALFSAVALVATLRMVTYFLPAWFAHPGYVAAVVFVALAPILAYVNLERFLVESPKVVPTTDARLALAGLMSEECSEAGRSLVVMLEPEPLLRPTVTSYGWKRDVTWRRLADSVNENDYGDYGCVVVVFDRNNINAAYNDVRERSPDVALIARLREEYGFRETHRETTLLLPFDSLTFIKQDETTRAQ